MMRGEGEVSHYACGLPDTWVCISASHAEKRQLRFFPTSVTVLCRELQLATVEFQDQMVNVPQSFHWWGVSLVFTLSGDVAELSG